MDEAQRNLKRQIERALLLDARFGPACLEEPGLGRLLQKLRGQAEKTDSVMLSSGVAAACAGCAKKTGSCCFREMGESFGFIQLFVNRLLGCELPEKSDFPGGCFFVGEKGCRLKARHSFCLNYFCPELIDTLGEETILTIQRQAGQQLLAGWELERALHSYVTSHSIPEHS